MILDRGIALLESLLGDDGPAFRMTSADRAIASLSGSPVTFAVRALATPPTPSIVRRDLLSGARGEAAPHILYVVPHVTASLRASALDTRRVSAVGVDDGVVIFEGTELSPKGVTEQRSRPRGRTAWGRFALMRVLLHTSRRRSQAQLAADTGVTQQAVALGLRGLAHLGVHREQGGWRVSDPVALWDAFLRNYPGPGGLRRYWTGVAPLDVQVDRALDRAALEDVEVLVSGDVAADRSAPLRRPATAAVYALSDIDLSTRFAPTSEEARTLTVVLPADPTVFATARAWRGRDPDVTDPLLTAWEVMRSRGPDRHEAVAHLRDVTLTEAGFR